MDSWEDCGRCRIEGREGREERVEANGILCSGVESWVWFVVWREVGVGCHRKGGKGCVGGRNRR